MMICTSNHVFVLLSIEVNFLRFRNLKFIRDVAALDIENAHFCLQLDVKIDGGFVLA